MKPTCWQLALLAVAAMAAGAANAQSDETASAGPAATTPPPVQVAPRTAPIGTNVQTLSNNNVPGANTNKVFASLDKGRKGFLDRDDVADNPFLSTHFGDCDKDGDDRLSRSEVTTCLQGRDVR
jgi:hypothetical protein